MLSIFTPCDARTEPFLHDAYLSLKANFFQDWEWRIGYNAGAIGRTFTDDPRVISCVVPDDDQKPHNRIGRLKNILCAECTGDVLVEMDADDLLTQDALQSIDEAFQDPKVHFAYSNSAMFDKQWASPCWSKVFGWMHSAFDYNGHKLVSHIAWPPTVHSLRRIEWAPNHVRAWRRASYNAMGGHNRDMISGDDHDLVCRTYLQYGESGMKHIDKCIYLYRLGGNTCSTHNATVQHQVALNYLNYIGPMAMRWAYDHQLKTYDLGGGISPQPGYTSVDLRGKADVFADLNGPWPFPDNSAGVLRAYHLIEHLDDVVHFFQEAYRVLAPGGFLFLEYPQAPGKGAYRDPTHKQFINEQTIWYFSDRNYAKFSGFTGRFQESRVDIYEMQPQVPVVVAELICLKSGYDRPAGEVKI